MYVLVLIAFRTFRKRIFLKLRAFQTVEGHGIDNGTRATPTEKDGSLSHNDPASTIHVGKYTIPMDPTWVLSMGGSNKNLKSMRFESLGKCSYQGGATTIAIDGATGAPKINGLEKHGQLG